MIEYVILAAHHSGEEGVWKEIGRRMAHNGRGAIQALLLDTKNTDLRAPAYWPIPVRYYKPEYPEVREVQKVVFGKSLAEAEE